MARSRTQSRSSGGLNALEYLEIPLRRPWHVALPFVAAVLAALAASMLLPKRYRSSTLILVESEKVPDAFVRTMATEKTSRRLQTIKQEILSRTRLETVIHELNPYGDLGTASLTATVERMQTSIDISVKGDDAFTISYVHRDPKMAQAVTNRLTTLFIEEVARGREQQVGEAYQFIESQLADARRELESREAALRRYKEQHMGTLPEQTAANLSTLQRLQLEQQAATDNLRLAMERLALLEGRPQGGAPMSSNNTELAQLRQQLQALRSRYTDEHPDVRAVLARIAALGGEVIRTKTGAADPAAAAAQVELEQARMEVDKLKAKRDDIEARSLTFQARVEQAPRTEADIATLSRDFQKLNENYLALLNKKLDAEMAAKLERRWKGEQFRVLDPASLPERHVFPNRPLFLIVGVVLGLAAGVAVSIVADFLDHSVKNVKEIEALLPYPILAVIPTVKRGRLGLLGVGHAWPRPAANEPVTPGTLEDLPLKDDLPVASGNRGR